MADSKPQKGNDRCPLCGEPVKPQSGGVVYHMECLKKDMAQVRKEINAEDHPRI